MTAVGDDGDNLVQQLADVIGQAMILRKSPQEMAHAVFASGLVTPVQPLRDLANQWEHEQRQSAAHRDWRELPYLGKHAGELRKKLPPAVVGK